VFVFACVCDGYCSCNKWGIIGLLVRCSLNGLVVIGKLLAGSQLQPGLATGERGLDVQVSAVVFSGVQQ